MTKEKCGGYRDADDDDNAADHPGIHPAGDSCAGIPAHNGGDEHHGGLSHQILPAMIKQTTAAAFITPPSNVRPPFMA